MEIDKNLEYEQIMHNIKENRVQRKLLLRQRDEIVVQIVNFQEEHSKLMDKKFQIRRKAELALEKELANNQEYENITSKIKENKRAQELLEEQYDETLYSLYNNNEDYFALKNQELCFKLDAQK